jgi:GT2 family glycosyltransferase
VTGELSVLTSAADRERADRVALPLGESSHAVRRSSVAVICPFQGSREEGAEVLERLRRISRTVDDELVLVDNTPGGVLAGLGPEDGTAKIVAAPLERSSYYARNVGAEAVTTEWLLFVDSDCRPQPSILDDYFVESIPSECGVVAGSIAGTASQTSLLARHARARGVLDQERLVRKERPFGATANLLVRKDTWAQVGGFHEGIRSGGDVDFCWRIQDSGWTLLYRKEARVEHDHRERLGGLVRQYARYGAGAAWLERRHPEMPRTSWHIALLFAAPLLILGHLITGKREQAAFRALDITIVLASRVGHQLDNRPASQVGDLGVNARVGLLAGAFGPAVLDAVTSLEQEGQRVWVEADARSSRTPASTLRGLEVAYLEDDGNLRRVVDLGWLLARHPVAAMRQVGASGSGLARLWRSAARTRRLEDRRVRALYARGDDDRAFAEARRLGSLIDARAERIDAETEP